MRAESVGRHVLADFHGVAPGLLRNKTSLMSLIRAALTGEGFHIIREASHSYPGENAGVTGVFLLGESHAAFHTYPEFEYMSLDIFSCGRADPRAAITRVAEALLPTQIDISSHGRGLLPPK